MTDFANYRDPETREQMRNFVCRQRGMDPAAAERALGELNHVGLAYVYRDMLEAQQGTQVAVMDYDPLAVGRS